MSSVVVLLFWGCAIVAEFNLFFGFYRGFLLGYQIPQGRRSVAKFMISSLVARSSVSSFIRACAVVLE